MKVGDSRLKTYLQHVKEFMLDSQLLEILVCPETRQPLQVAEADTLARVNAAIAKGALKARSGQNVAGELAGALVREDGALLYPVRDDIPIMLVDEAIDLGQLS